MGSELPKVLVLSNGYGEDRIAAAIARRCRDLDLRALPLVGEGAAYRAAGIPICGPTAALPSGGFILHDRRALAGDLARGLIGLTARQIGAVRSMRAEVDLVVAVGDLLPLALAWLTGRPYVLVGCAKSDHYVGGRFSDYFAHERWFLAHRRCLAVYPRDSLTARNLVQRGYRAFDLGNPMMDDLEPWAPVEGAAKELAIGLLPGSRQEAYANMAALLACCQAIASGAPAGERVVFRAALADQIDPARIAACALAVGWHRDERDDGCLVGPAGERLWLEQGRFARWCRSVRLVVGLSGTANEQCAGLGLPVVTFPGVGPQFDARFARRQTLLLGESITLVEDAPEAVGQAVWRLLGDPERLARIAANGRQRMGPAGASERIAEHVRGLASGGLTAG